MKHNLFFIFSLTQFEIQSRLDYQPIAESYTKTTRINQGMYIFWKCYKSGNRNFDLADLFANIMN